MAQACTQGSGHCRLKSLCNPILPLPGRAMLAVKLLIRKSPSKASKRLWTMAMAVGWAIQSIKMGSSSIRSKTRTLLSLGSSYGKYVSFPCWRDFSAAFHNRSSTSFALLGESTSGIMQKPSLFSCSLYCVRIRPSASGNLVDVIVDPQIEYSLDLLGQVIRLKLRPHVS